MIKKIIFVMGVIGVSLLPLQYIISADRQQGGSIVFEFSEETVTTTLARELGLTVDRMEVIRRTNGACSVEFELPIRVDHNQVFDRNGNLVAEEFIEHNELQDWQTKVLNRFMIDISCGRFVGP